MDWSVFKDGGEYKVNKKINKSTRSNHIRNIVMARNWLDNYYRWMLMEDLSWEMTLELNLNDKKVWTMWRPGGKSVGRGNSKCKGWKAGMSLVSSGNVEWARVAPALWGRRSDTRDKQGLEQAEPQETMEWSFLFFLMPWWSAGGF